MPTDNERQDWVARVLGVALQANGSQAAHAGAATLPVWQAARQSVDRQLGALAAELRETGIPELTALAHDVETLLDEVSPSLSGALQGFDQAPGNPAYRSAALAALGAASAWVDGDKRLRAVDGNLFGVTVTASATLRAALQDLQHLLAKPAGPAA
jgi:hypothetical protein